ncbi:MAG: Rpn family recombination-promoting nuclease/putative transposase [Blautia sp.]|nr:Rpn family recombination-promoting nuclease/putative transposase [Blautia sp.]
MAQKDMAEKLLEDYNEVFADIVNVLLFEGERVVEPDSLLPAVAGSQYKADDGKLHEQERDIAKFWTEEGVCISLLGVENQSRPDPGMALRVIGYDGQSYRSQLLKQPDGTYLKKHYPVITMVLYFGLDESWNCGMELYDVLEFRDERLKKYVSNYKINVFDIPSLPEETVNRFQSDFRYVADFFVQIKKNGDYVPAEGTIEHVDEVLKLLSVMTGDSDFENLRAEAGEGR